MAQREMAILAKDVARAVDKGPVPAARLARARLGALPRVRNGHLIRLSMRLGGVPTSVALEPQFWAELGRIANDRKISLTALMLQIDKQRHSETSLASAARIFALVNPPAGPGRLHRNDPD
jgi:predicted DNA-binding ribbon-helix-helix protein